MLKTSMYWRELSELRVKGLKYGEFTIYRKSEETYNKRSRVEVKWLDEYHIQVGRDENLIYTDRTGIDMVVNAIKEGEIKIVSGVAPLETINIICRFLTDAGQEYKVALTSR